MVVFYHLLGLKVIVYGTKSVKIIPHTLTLRLYFFLTLDNL